MKTFKVKPVKKNRQLNNAGKTVLTTAVLGAVASTSCFPVVGLPMFNSYTKAKALSIIKEQFSSELSIDLSTDIAVNITDGIDDIIFVADLYNADHKIAVEITDRYDYSDLSDDLILSKSESELIKDNKFADHDILNIDSLSEYSFEYDLQKFIDYLKN